MYAFTPVQCDSQPKCYVELSRPSHDPGPFFRTETASRGNEELRRCQTREVFHIARKTLGVETSHAIEKVMLGESYDPDERKRWWEKVRHGRFKLASALARNEPKSLMWMEMLSRYTDEADRLFSMPLWDLSAIAGVSVNTVMDWRPAVEAMGVQIPRFPDQSEGSGLRYMEQLLKPLKDPRTMWAGFNVAVFCLRLAQAQGHLAHYVLTYESIVSDRWPWYVRSESEMDNLLLFFGEWYSTLKLRVWTKADLIEIEKDLKSYGLSVHFVQYSQQDDSRYTLANSLFGANANSDKKSLVLKVSVPG